MVAARGGQGGGNARSLFNGYRVSVFQGGKVLKICFTAMRIYSTVLNCTLRND